MCLGYSLGLRVIWSSLANLLYWLTRKLPEGMKRGDLNVEVIYGLPTPRKITLVALGEPRLPFHLYRTRVGWQVLSITVFPFVSDFILYFGHQIKGLSLIILMLFFQDIHVGGVVFVISTARHNE